ncbi:hypothetical protein BK142_24765 [Paenibacillus glucanolyticus]|nr:hypothetical protein BK142_24765 [Paenibacillus glucanolyticus]
MTLNEESRSSCSRFHRYKVHKIFVIVESTGILSYINGIYGDNQRTYYRIVHTSYEFSGREKE